MIKIILIDDHALIRAGMRQMLTAIKGIQVIGEARTGQEGIEQVRRLQPDIVLLDLKLPDMEGLAVAKQLLRNHSAIKILVVSAITQDLTILRLLEAGTCGYISKHSPVEELTQAIQTIHSGKKFISSKLASQLALSKAETNAKLVFAEITDREKAVMERIIRCVPVKEIAEELKINHKTVHSYRERIFQKLGVDSDLALALLAAQHGLFTLDAKSLQIANELLGSLDLIGSNNQ